MLANVVIIEQLHNKKYGVIPRESARGHPPAARGLARCTTWNRKQLSRGERCEW
jgi:hypothetical protein